jgi:hypothetical protein
MSSAGWRNLCLVLGVVCVAQLWRDCSRAPDPAPAPDSGRAGSAARSDRSIATGTTGATDDRSDRSRNEAQPSGKPGSDSGLSIYGFTVPSWAIWLAPHPGEDLRSYRDRVLPLAQAAIAPQRARVDRSRDNFAALANLAPHQRDELDSAAQETAAALQERVLGAVLNGELLPSTFKPMAGVSVARDLLDIVGRGNRRFLDSLHDDQRAKLAQHPFDFGDYLVFSTPWEDALKFLD